MKGTTKGVTQCWMGPTTLAGDTATQHIVLIVDGVVAGTMVQMRAKGTSANIGVLEALTAKFGEPDKDQRHLGKFRWRQGDVGLSFDTTTGDVMVQDLGAMGANAAKNAEKAKADL